jgi:hypothetical protein
VCAHTSTVSASFAVALVSAPAPAAFPVFCLFSLLRLLSALCLLCLLPAPHLHAFEITLELTPVVLQVCILVLQ